MTLYSPCAEITAEIWTALPKNLRRDVPTDWATANRPGHSVDCFLEGPSFDRDGNLWLVDIPHGRVFRVSPDRVWTLAAEYDGWPNGLKIHRDGRIFIADYKHGIMQLDARAGTVRPVVVHRNSEHFLGCNDLVFDRRGRLYFTDQGQSGLHKPNGRVFRYDLEADRLDLLLDNGPSPNGIVFNKDESALYVAMTRANGIWRLPIMRDGFPSKVGLFIQLSGGLAGPDGLALGANGELLVAHAGNGCVWVFSPTGEPVCRIRCPNLLTTNIAFGGEGGRSLFIVESETSSVLKADLPFAGMPLFSHADQH